MRDVATLTTERFTMRPLQQSDTAALFPTMGDPEQCTYLTRAEFRDQEELWDWLSSTEWPGRTWIAVDKAGSVAGRFTASPGHVSGIEEIGYIVCKNRQGEGIARECTAALIAHLFEEGARKLTAEVDTRNTPSIRLLESLGFTREGTFREHDETHIGLCDVYLYGLLVSERSDEGLLDT